MSGVFVLEQFVSCKCKRVRQAAFREDAAFRAVMTDLYVFLLATTARWTKSVQFVPKNSSSQSWLFGLCCIFLLQICWRRTERKESENCFYLLWCCSESHEKWCSVTNQKKGHLEMLQTSWPVNEPLRPDQAYVSHMMRGNRRLTQATGLSWRAYLLFQVKEWTGCLKRC